MATFSDPQLLGTPREKFAKAEGLGVTRLVAKLRQHVDHPGPPVFADDLPPPNPKAQRLSNHDSTELVVWYAARARVHTRPVGYAAAGSGAQLVGIAS